MANLSNYSGEDALAEYVENKIQRDPALLAHAMIRLGVDVVIERLIAAGFEVADLKRDLRRAGLPIPQVLRRPPPPPAPTPSKVSPYERVLSTLRREVPKLSEAERYAFLEQVKEIAKATA